MHVRHLFVTWNNEWVKQNNASNAELFGSLFQHLKEDSPFYLLLHKRNLFHLFLQIMFEQNGPKAEYDNMSAYVTSFMSYGTYGWINEWIARGMQESAEKMAELLSSHGMK
ncbi:MAG: TetR-like C-terminal domain-containing protein [Enterococcus sp.]